MRRITFLKDDISRTGLFGMAMPAEENFAAWWDLRRRCCPTERSSGTVDGKCYESSGSSIAIDEATKFCLRK